MSWQESGKWSELFSGSRIINAAGVATSHRASGAPTLQLAASLREAGSMSETLSNHMSNPTNTSGLAIFHSARAENQRNLSFEDAVTMRFQELREELLSLHDEEVSALRRENRRLRTRIEPLGARVTSEGPDAAIASFLSVQERSNPVMRTVHHVDTMFSQESRPCERTNSVAVGSTSNSMSDVSFVSGALSSSAPLAASDAARIMPATDGDQTNTPILYAPRSTWLSKYDMVSTNLIAMHSSKSWHFLTSGTNVSARTQGSFHIKAMHVLPSFHDGIHAVDPHSGFAKLWSLLSALMLCCDIFLVPFDVAFGVSETGYLLAVVWTGRCFWTADIFVNMVSARHIKGFLERRIPRTAGHYLRTWFFFDVSVVIFEWVLFFLSIHMYNIRLVRIAKLFRLVRFLRVKKLRKLGREVATFISLSLPGCADIFADAVRIVSVSAIGLHLSTCFWYAVGGRSENGWVMEQIYEESSRDSILDKYVSSLYWTISIYIGQSTVYPRTTFEQGFASAAKFVGLIFMCFLIAKTNHAVMILSESKVAYMWKICARYLEGRKISPWLSSRVRHTLRAYHEDGLGERLHDEARVLDSLPQAIQIDLHAEVRGSILVHMQFFADLHAGKPRILRQLGFVAMHNILALKEETIFAPGDVSNCMFFVDFGALNFCTIEEIKNESVRRSSENFVVPGPFLQQLCSGSSSYGEETFVCGTILGPNDWVSEPVLWLNWEHRGELTAEVDSILLTLNASSFFDVIATHQDACVHAVKYCRHFAWHLNHGNKEASDLFKVELPISELDRELFAGSEEDHFVFISHYKKEAGTEAALMHGQLEQVLREDPNNLASELCSPVFLDSENLTDLKTLTEHVKRSRNLILLLTPDVLTRPWCLVEIVIAQRNNVPILPVEVQRPGDKFEYPSEEFYERLRKGEVISDSDQSLLVQEGIEPQHLEAAVREVFTKIALPFSPQRTCRIRQAELLDILNRLPPMQQSS